MSCETAQIVTVIASSVSALAAVALMLIALKQLPYLGKQMKAQAKQLEGQAEELKIQGEREQKWETVKACERYTSDTVICKATEFIWGKSKHGTDYTEINGADHDLILFMNYLEGLAVGADQGIYNKKILKDNMSETVYKAVKALMRGQSGELYGKHWEARNALFQDREFPFLIKLFNEWFDQSPDASFKESL